MQYNQDSKFWHFATLVADFILLNLLFIFLCIPIITIGPALAALIVVIKSLLIISLIIILT